MSLFATAHRHLWISVLMLAGMLGSASRISAQVSANFTASQLSGCSPLTVTFTDLSTGPIHAWFWDFGNGNTSTFDDVIATYTTPGTYTVSLTVTDTLNGISSTRTEQAYITVFADPAADFTLDTTAGCAPLAVQFTDVSAAGSGAIVSRIWDFGDGTIGTGASVSHTYATAGSYDVTLVVEDANGCRSTRIRSDVVTTTEVASVDFTASPRIACAAPLTVRFTPSISPAGSYTYYWDFGDGYNSTDPAPFHTYTTAGDYTVTLTIYDGNGCQEQVRKTSYVIINRPTAAFSALDTTVCTGQPVQFINSSTGADSYLWNFGDGNTSTAANPMHSYAVPGLYSIALTATNSAGCSNLAGRSGYIRVYASPAPGFLSPDPVGCELPATVSFQNQSLGNIISWYWVFGNGDFSTSPNPITVYSQPGMYDVSLTVTTADGCQATETVPDYVRMVPPAAGLIASRTEGCVPLTVNFADLSASPADPIVSWFWNFGDGNFSSAQNPTHVYTVPGEYTVILTVTTASGCRDTEVFQFIQAGIPPAVDFTATPRVSCVEDPIAFTDLTTIGATEWYWNFGDGGTSNQQNPVHAYNDTGLFTVTLIVEYFGCRDTLVRPDYIRILDPVADFIVNPQFACHPPVDVVFTDQSTSGSSWFWSFGDGATSALQNPVHQYTTNGTFNVTLTVTDLITGCADDYNAVVDIRSPSAHFSVQATRGCVPFTADFTNGSFDATAYRWDFGDGNTSTAANPSHTYTATGTYTVTLIATNGACSDTLVRTALVDVVGPVPDFRSDVSTGCVPLSVRFDDLSVPRAGTTITGWSWDFGDGGVSNSQNPTYAYGAAGSYDVTLTVLDSDGCLASVTRTDIVQPTQPEAAFSSTDTLSCPGALVRFVSQSSGVGLTYLWSFGDGTSSTLPNPVKLYAPNATYTVTLTVTDINGCTDSEIKFNYVSINRPDAGFSADTTSATCPPLQVNFTDQSSPNVVSWYWDFGDGSTSTLRNPSKLYAVAGSYDVTLMVTTAQGCRDTMELDDLIQISGPTGAFSFAPTSGCRPLNVTFLATNPNPAWDYAWDFGDGTGGSGTVITHTYYNDTVASPLMLVEDPFGCIVSVRNTNQVNILPLPRPSFAANRTQVCLGQSVRFTNTTTSERAVTGYIWDFGDGNISTAVNPVHTYLNVGSYTVQLIATTVDGCMDTSSVPVTIQVTGPPQAAFTTLPASACQPGVISFTDASTSTFPIVSWAWDFGDGLSDNGQFIAPHTYAAAGGYSATLTVRDNQGCTGSVSRSVQINPLPVVNFSAFRYGCAPVSVQFTDLSAGSSPAAAWEWNFGDGTTSTLRNPLKTYTTDGYYTVSLTVTDANGCRNTLTRPNYIQLERPVANFTSNGRTTCPPQRVRFTDLSIPDTTITWFWNFGDGGTSTARNPIYTYDDPGTYTVTLIITNIFGCSDTIVRPNHVRVQLPPLASFTVSDSADCVPENILFTNTSTPLGAPLVAYTWNFGTGAGVSTPNASFNYTVPGTYQARLIVRDNNGCRDTAFKTIFIYPNPDANFAASDTVGCAVTTIGFTDLSTGVNSPVSWQWTFGDGNIGTIQNPVNTYFNDGQYSVKLRVEDINGCVDSLTKSNYIYLDHPEANFSVSSIQACPGTTVSFTDLSTGTFARTTWFWRFGDGQTSTLRNPTHVYTAPGNYTVTLIVGDAIGCSDTLERSLLITVPAGPTAQFTYGPSQGCDPLTVGFTNTSISGTAPIVAWEWFFGDGGGSQLASPVYTYNTPGLYTAVLRVTDGNGCQDTVRRSVRVLEVPTVNFSASTRRGCAPQQVTFTDLSTSPYVKTGWFWDFGDGNTSTSPSPVHTYLADGAYTVKLVVTDQNGCRDSVTRISYIRLSHPVAHFTMDATEVCPNVPIGVSFTDHSTPDTTLASWLWNFGDGQSSTQQHPTHSYAVPGSYTVSLTVTNVLGCSDTYTLSTPITVLTPPDTRFQMSDSLDCAPLSIVFTDQTTQGGAPVISWHWDFGNGDSSLVRNPSYTWHTPGVYQVTLTATDLNGCQTRYTRPVRALAVPVANFRSPDTLGCAPSAVDFVNLSTSVFPVNFRKWYFGDGDSAMLIANPTHTYLNDGDYTVTLIVGDVNGCRDTLTRPAYIRLSHPVADFSMDQTRVCPGVPVGVSFRDQSIADTTLVSWLWQFGDGNTSTLPNPSHSYAAAGNYTIILTVTNLLGCSDSDTLANSITVLAPPVASFTVNDADGCVPLNVVFNESSAPGAAPIIDWNWQFGDGGSSLVPDPGYSYTAGGTYTAVLTVTDANGCQDTAQRVIRAFPVPVAHFQASDTAGCAPDAITFTDLSTSAYAITGWNWSFGDGGSAITRNPTYTYANDGIYTVSLTVTDINGCQRSFTRPNYIRLTHPAANFTWDRSTGCPGTSIAFTDVSVADHTTTAWFWEFGDGSTSTLQHPSHTYLLPGLYTVRLTITNALGCQDTEVKAAIIRIYQPPSAATDPGNTGGCNPLTVDFEDGSTAGDAAMTSWFWNLGNGNTFNGFNPAPQTYTPAGTYTVQLIVTDANGCRDTAQTQVQSYAPPAAAFVASDTVGCAPAQIRFTDQSSGAYAITSWLWEFGDGNTSSQRNPTHTYAADGVYTVRLTVTDVNGCQQTRVRTQYIRLSHPSAAFTLNNSIGCTGTAVTFTDQSSGAHSIASYFWSFGDGTTSTQQHPVKLFSMPGTYTVSLTVTDVLGCTDTETRVAAVRIYVPPAAATVPASPAGCAPLTVDYIDGSAAGDGAIISWSWDFGNGNTATGINPAPQIFVNPGLYQTRLVVTDVNGCRDTVLTPVQVYTPPVAQFVASDTAGCAPAAIRFTDQSSGPAAIAAWAWNFGDGNTSTQRNPVHTYAADGTYTVRLTVTDANGCQHTRIRTNYIRLTHPAANFIVNRTTGCPGTIFNFTNQSVPDYPIASYSWDFGDGTTASVMNPAKVYMTPGLYTVQLTITNILNCSDTEVKTGLIRIFNRPAAATAPGDTAGCSPFVADFADASAAGDAALTGWAWTFGNGNTATGVNPAAQTFATPGIYQVQLIVTDANGCRDTALTRVQAYTLPSAQFVASDTVGCAPKSIRFTDQSSGPYAITAWFWDFGDGNTSTQRTPTHLYASDGTYTVRLTVTDANGCQHTRVRTNYIRLSHPVADFTVNLNAICPGTTLGFTDQSVSDQPIASWLWDFGDGTSSTQRHPNKTYTVPGLYHVTLTITNALGCGDTEVKTNYIRVYNRPVAATAPGDTAGCYPFVADFIDASVPGDAGLSSWAWNFGNGQTATGFNPPPQLYPAPGVFTVQLMVSDANGCRDTAWTTVRSLTHPTADFTANQTRGCAPASIRFTDLSSGDYAMAAWRWDFGDGNTSTQRNPVHSYAADGTYTVRLIVWDANGCSDTLQRTDYIQLHPPVAGFTVNDPDGCTGLSVQFTNTSTADTTQTAWSWTFGNGQSSTQQHPTVVYAAPGLYTVRLIVTDALGCRDTLVRSNLVQIYQSPVAAFTPSDPAGCAPHTLSFVNGSTSSAAAITGYSWTFGNGQTSTLANPSASYPLPGTYTVGLTVTDANGCSGTASQTITVHGRPTADFFSNTRATCSGVDVTFTNISSGPNSLVGWKWYFGDGDSSTAVSPVHTYSQSGYYNVTLIAYDIFGCSDTITRANYLRIRDPQANFTVSKTDLCPGESVRFTDLSVPDTTLVDWRWEFGDGTISGVQNPLKSYLTPGTYTVRLIVTNILGCRDTMTRLAYIRVATRPDAAFVPSDLEDCTPFAVNFANTSTAATWPITAYLWEFGNGQTSAMPAAGVTYTVPGTYTVRLIATDQNGCSDTAVQTLRAFTLPQPAFTASNRTGCAPRDIAFLNQSTGDYALTGHSWAFGDGNTSVQQFPTHTYLTDGTYDVRLTVTDLNGCANTVTYPQYIRLSHPQANFTMNAASICPGTSVQFSDLSIPDTTIAVWSWDFGDGATSAQRNPAHVYSQPGQYTVRLTVRNVLGCEDTEIKTQLIEVLQRPGAQFVPSSASGCVPLPVAFTNTTLINSAPVSSWAWDFGNGVTSTAISPALTFALPGTYPVRLIATDIYGCADTVTQNIRVFALPVANFQASDTIGCSVADITFFSTTSGSSPVRQWRWEFGDGNVSTAPIPVNSYQQDGMYDVRLMVTDANGCRDTVFKPQYIRLSHPQANFRADRFEICPGETIQFTDLSAADTTLAGWSWSFGDGSSSTQRNPSRTYTVPGVYTVTLTVTNVLSCSDTEVKTAYITVLAPPSAAFDASQTEGCVPVGVNFTDGSTGNPSPVVSWSWDLGNGLTSAIRNPSAFYALPGEYTASLIVRDLKGCADTAEQVIQVYTLPVANFLASDTAGCEEAITFFDISATDYAISGWMWYFGDGDSSAQQQPVHTYQETGTYSVTLVVEDIHGCSDTLTKPEYITLTRPQAAFAQDLDVVCPGSDLQFLDLSTPDYPITGWYWTFGDGTTSTQQNPVHTYQHPGMYTVTLTITNVYNCTATAVGLVEVLRPPVSAFSVHDPAGCTPHTVSFTDLSVSFSAPIIYRQWNFGDGTSSTSLNPVHTYSAPGVYQVVLSIMDGNGCTHDTAMTVEALAIPAANFTSDLRAGCAPETVQFTSTSTSVHPIVSWYWTFGDGSASALRNPAHAYAADGLYTVSLTVTDANGCSSTLTRPEYIRLRHPQANFVSMPSAGCPGTSIRFTDTSVQDTAIASWFWDFGDGTTSTLQHPVKVYHTPGLYTVTLTVTNILGCEDTEVKPNLIRIHTPPVAEFSPADTAGCTPLTVPFVNRSTAGSSALAGFQWNFGSGPLSALLNPVRTFTNPGLYQVRMIAIDANGCRDTAVHPVHARPLPVPTFTADPRVGCAPEQVAFTDQTLNAAGIVSWLWTFGDGATSTQRFPTHTYLNDGVYDVSLTLTDVTGCVGTTARPQYIRLRHPQADFSVSDTAVCPGISVQFMDRSIPDTTLTSWRWDFGDGTTSTQQNPSKLYTAAGVYTVKLTVRNLLGCEDEEVRTQVIRVLAPPVASFAPSSVQGCEPLTVAFQNTTTYTSSPVASWDWRFENGHTSIFPNPSTVFQTAGQYEVQLIATDGYGCRDTAAQTIIVFRKPDARFIASDTVGCSPETMVFLDQSVQGDAPLSAWLWNFGDGITAGQQFPAHTYSSDGNYTVTLSIIDANGCRDTLVRPQYIRLSRPQPDFITSTQQVCPGTVVSFFDQTAADTTLVSWQWNFGDGTTGTGRNVSHAYTASGDYTITLTVTNVLGCSETIVRSSYIDVINAPLTLFTPASDRGCAPFTTSFQDNSMANGSPIVSWLWDLGNGDLSTAQNPSATYASPGIYTVTLMTTDNNGCTSTFTREVEALRLPRANFMSLDTVGCAPATAAFNDLSTGPAPVTGWLWSFGDGETSSQQFPSHLYQTEGWYTVSLTAIDANGCRDTLVKPQYVRLSNPDADFSPSVTVGCPGLTVQFTDLSIPDTTLVSWLWSFGDGTTSVVRNPAHTYTQPGVYAVSLTVRNVLGCVHTKTVNNAVTVATPPVADFTVADSVGCTPLDLGLRDRSQAFSSPIVSWSWDFGNGTTSAAQEPAYAYTQAGTYTVRLTVTDAIGCSDTHAQVVIAAPTPRANFTANDSVGCAPQTFQFTNLGFGLYPINSWTWSFGDGNTSTGRNPAHTYLEDGNYTVSLIVSDLNGCADTMIKPFYIRLSHPEADFFADVRAGCEGTAVQFSDASLADTTLVAWRWEFGDGDISIQRNPLHVYNTWGVFDVRLIVTNVLGCSDTLLLPQYIRIYEPPAASIVASDTSGCVPFLVEFEDFSSSPYGISSWQWYLDGQPKGASQTITHYFVTTGTYEVMLVVTDNNGCTDTVRQMVYVRPIPVADFSVSDSLSCGPVTLSFRDRTVHTPVQWLWTFGDGTTSNEQNPAHTYQDDGIYTVRLQVTDRYGCTDDAEKINYIRLAHPQVDFTVDYKPGCPPVIATFRAEGSSQKGIAKWTWNFGDGRIATTLTDSVVHAYRASGVYTVTLTATDSLDCETSVIKPNLVNVLDNIIPAPVSLHAVSVLSDRQIEIVFAPHQGEDFKQYTIYREEPGQGYVPIFTTPYVSDTVFIDNGVEANRRSYCYKVTATNFCDSESDLNLTDAHCTVNAMATPIPGQIILTWTPYRGWTQVQQYEIYQVTSYNPLMVNFVDVVPGNTIRYIQPFEDCFNNIAYRVRAVGATPLQVSWSDTTQAVSKRGQKGDPADMVRATVENNVSVLVEWKDVQLPGLAKIFVEKSEDGANFQGLATLPPGEEKFRDNDVDVQSESYTYRLFAQDSCGNYTPMSNVAKSILLSAEKQFNTTLLRWTPYEAWQFGVQHYVIELFVDTTGQYTEIARVDGSVHEYLDRFTTLDQPLYCYRIRAIEMPGGNSAWSLSNEVCVRVESGIHAPNAFTPNEDGINDRFYLQGIHVQTFNLQIFSRWGLLMFETNDISEGWDGFYQGEKAPEGTYVYVARGVGYNGMPYLIKGTLTLMR